MLEDVYISITEVTETSYDADIFMQKNDFYTSPLPSTHPAIFRTDETVPYVKGRPLSDLQTATQCVKLAYKTRHVLVPLLHMNWSQYLVTPDIRSPSLAFVNGVALPEIE